MVVTEAAGGGAVSIKTAKAPAGLVAAADIVTVIVFPGLAAQAAEPVE